MNQARTLRNAKDCESGDNDIMGKGEKATEEMDESCNGKYQLDCPLDHDLINKLSVIIGTCDLMVGKHLRIRQPCNRCC